MARLDVRQFITMLRHFSEAWIASGGCLPDALENQDIAALKTEALQVLALTYRKRWPLNWH